MSAPTKHPSNLQEVSLEAIKTKAKNLHNINQRWHFHILTPNCGLNWINKYVFVLESHREKTILVHYSDEAEKELGQELSPLLHGAKILSLPTTDQTYKPSQVVQKMIARVKVMTAQGIEWHHHVLFPDCQFNKHAPKFAFIVEDPLAGEMIESLSDEEPTRDLKQIEGLFYKSNS